MTDKKKRKEIQELYKSEKKLRDFFREVFWRNARIEGLEGEESETGLSKFECDAIEAGIDNIAFHVHNDILAFLPKRKENKSQV
jgi:hypothetical protein